MVYGALSNLTTVALLAHLLLGCCWHHAHEWRIAPRGKDTADGSCDHSHSPPAGHAHFGCTEPGGEREHDRGDCDGGRCVFIPGQLVRMPVTFAAQFGELMRLAAADDAGRPMESGLYPNPIAATGCCPPLRAHLLHQVLLL